MCENALTQDENERNGMNSRAESNLHDVDDDCEDVLQGLLLLALGHNLEQQRRKLNMKEPVGQINQTQDCLSTHLDSLGVDQILAVSLVSLVSLNEGALRPTHVSSPVNETHFISWISQQHIHTHCS